MKEQPTICETLEFRVMLVDPAFNALLVQDTSGGYRLPRIRVARWLRLAQQLQKEIQTAWGVPVVILNIIKAHHSSGPFVIAETLTPVISMDFKAIAVRQLPPSELSEEECAVLTSLLNGEVRDPFSYVGWIDHAIRWVESETGRKITSRNEIEQYNAGGGFALARFPMAGGQDYWLKATGEPNRHEPVVTNLLSELGGGYVADVLAWKPEWNAVLIAGTNRKRTEVHQQTFELLEDAVESMAELQRKTKDSRLDLLEAGAFEQGMDVFLKRSSELFDYLEESMGVETPVKTHRLERRRIREIREIFERICERIQFLDIPETIVHGDMNPSNIVFGCGRCHFIDWSEAYVGNCLVTLQHLLLLNRTEDAKVRGFMNAVLKRKYLDVWLASHDAAPFEEGLAYMPLLGAVSALYGRGNWLTSPERNAPGKRLYARTLALHMDSAVSASELQDAYAIHR